MAGGDLGFYEVAIGLAFDVGADFFALLEVGRDNDTCMQARCKAFVTECAEHLDAGDGRYHEVKQNDVVLVRLSGSKALLAVADRVDLVAGFDERSVVELTNKVFVFDNEDFIAYGRYLCRLHD